ncbi:MAG: (Fe-S)-binding protein [Chloroflexota bacterium]|nr:MAG: (Fe-S)-binding protein [Chloroflexota bacterium]
MGAATLHERIASSDCQSDSAGNPVAGGSLSLSEPLVIDDRLWARVMDLTGGAAAVCFQCGVCTAACPWGLVRNETLPVRSLMRQAQLGLESGGTDAWLCTTCRQCEAYCPRGVRIGDVMRGLRYLDWEERRTPPGLATLLWSLHGNNNPWNQPPSTRAVWARDLAIPRFDADQHEILLYVGCTAAYDRRVQDVTRALASVLRAAGISFGTLGDDEPCCGESALNLGHKPFFDELIGEAADRFEQNAVSRLITVSPHCYDSFKNHLPVGTDELEVMHYVQYLARLVAEDRLSFDAGPVGRIVFHDPCYLARHHGDAHSARNVLGALPGIDLVEMEQHGPDTLCCGGGGGRMWLETAADERFADIRIGQAVDVQAQILCTACPFCLVCLEDSAKALKVKNLRVLDLVEILSQAL